MKSMPPRLQLGVPLIALVLAFTALPLEFRAVPARVPDLFRAGLQDIVLNIVGYIPIGIVLAPSGAAKTILVGTAISGVAELVQVFSIGRSPSLVDLATNILGTLIGWYIARRLKVSLRFIVIGRGAGKIAAVLVLAYLAVGARFVPRDFEDAVAATFSSADALGPSVNARGTTDPGRLEAAWQFGSGAGAVVDASENALGGSLKNGAKVVGGEAGNVLTLEDGNQYVDVGDPYALRLVGSITLSAWIRVSSFSQLDGAIVSRRERFGYQLDTTLYRGPSVGPHTIGFRLTNASGRLMARFGRTALDSNRWHHVAGVYDAGERTLNVYLDGRLDNGCLIGNVTSRQLLSESHVLIGRSGRRDGFWFKGNLDDVRVYSRPLSQSEIEKVVVETARGRSLAPPGEYAAHYPGWDEPACAPRPRDARVSGLFVTFGLLTAVACVGLWPTRAFQAPAIAASVVAGLVALLSVPDMFPNYYRLCIPLLFLAGGVVAVVSIRPSVESESMDRQR